MKKILNELTLKIVELPIPILKHSKWVEVAYPQTMSEPRLTETLDQSLPEIEKFAKEKEIKQIKISTNPFWKKLTSVGLIKTVYYLTIKASTLAKISARDYPVVNLQDPIKIKHLIKGQFLYHCQYKPIYFTCDIENRVNWFIDLARESIEKNKGFLLGVKINKKLSGFLYGEFYENEGCIDELFIEEKNRGKGLGKLLLRKAGENFLAKKLETVGVFVGVDEESLGFYEKFGFKKEFANWIRNL